MGGGIFTCVGGGKKNHLKAKSFFFLLFLGKEKALSWKSQRFEKQMLRHVRVLFFIPFSFTRPRLRHSREKPENPGLSFLVQHVSAALGPSFGVKHADILLIPAKRIPFRLTCRLNRSQLALIIFIFMFPKYCRIFHPFYESGSFSHFEQQKDATWQQICGK